ncbi:mechanosensitive ion channel family protein [Rhodanobacter sp. FW102-FHT14D06]|uniref:Mechanosensitive ion channel family protein n=2 Tax=unclassified Rhodanobacter TaxID=2621553 RepID=A0AB74UXM5_9GAMM
MADIFTVWWQLWQQHVAVRLGVTVVAGLLLALVLRVAIHAVLRRLAGDRPVIADLMQRAHAPLQWLLPLLSLLLMLRYGPALDSAPMALVEHLLLIGLLAAGTWLVVRCVGAFEGAAVRRYPMDAADNLQARRVVTQVRVLARTADVVVIVLGTAIILLTIPGVRQLGASLLASAGVAGLAIGLAARPVLSNLIAGLQIALTQPIRLDDVVIIEGEWGRIEEIAGSYVVVRIWDERRLVVPLNWRYGRHSGNFRRNTAKWLY